MNLIQKIRRELFTISLFFAESKSPAISIQWFVCAPPFAPTRRVLPLCTQLGRALFQDDTSDTSDGTTRSYPDRSTLPPSLIDPLSNRESGNGVRLHLLCIQSRTPVMPQPLFLELTWHLRYYGSLLASERNRRVPHNAP